ncbi:hypothetical protein CCY99_03040 [Helicobacter sp. 16-1353]|uniref:FkbM family methyltransferase n=1 Tax=Helicobacter sp. 16-1353 TaxID=2004996 RepID=UPI000DCD1659|nr:FkbM family methyltransferase [Helicobacter sp. 16-1353]RAX54752.1 hypothetical protein CCY99_03040 [Helicobacter sp. 16-1353]
MANMGYKVLQYDASINTAPYNHPNITFIKKFVGVKDSCDTISFERVVRENSLDKNHHNIMQIDIEGAEWDILREIDLGFVSQYFPQIVFEFHDCNPNDIEGMKMRLPILEKLRKYYTPIHTHFNNNGSIFYGKGLFLSTCIEVSYVRNDLVENLSVLSNSTNSSDVKDLQNNKQNLNPIYKSGLGNIVGLDSPNTKGYPDVPIIFYD